MQHATPTKAQLVQEIRDLQRRLAALEESEAEHQRAEEALRQSRNFLRSIIEAIPEVTMVVDRECRVVLANRAARSRVGGEDPVSAGLKCYQVSRHRETPCADDEWPCPLALVIETKAPVTVVHTHFDAAGRELVVEVSAAPILDESDEVVRIIESCRDITALHEAQQQLVPAERLAAIGEAMAGLTHESRNALQRSQACLDLLASRLGDRPDVLDLLRRLQEAQNHLQRLYDEVRQYAAPIVLHPEGRDVRSVFRETWEQTAGLRQGRQVQLVEAAADADCSCEVDALALQQVFGNVLENALDAGRDPVIIEVHYGAAEIAGRPALRMAIRDHGPGLTPDQQRRIFDACYTTKARGTGLGMALAKRLIAAHAGRISVGTTAGVGTEILVTLPRRQSGSVEK